MATRTKKRRISGPGRLGSMEAARKSVAKKGNRNLRIIPANDSITVRFLTEPEDFHGFYEHYVNDTYVPCTEGDCEGCDEGVRKDFRYLCNAYIVDDSKVMALKIPKSVFEDLLTYHKKYGTIRDRDYDLSRSGSGKNDTRYAVAPDSPRKVKLSRFDSKMFDLDEVLASLLDDPDVDDEDDDEDDDEPRSKKKKSKPSKSKRDPWADDDEDDDEEEEEERPRRKVKKSASKKTVKKTSKSKRS